jgi:hypothetical protein
VPIILSAILVLLLAVAVFGDVPLFQASGSDTKKDAGTLVSHRESGARSSCDRSPCELVPESGVILFESMAGVKRNPR